MGRLLPGSSARTHLACAAVFLAISCTDDTAPADDSTPDDSGPGVIDGQMPESGWSSNDGEYMLVRADGSACMRTQDYLWGAVFNGPLTVSDGTFSWAGTHWEEHGPKHAPDDGAPVTATGTVTPTLLAMHVEIEGSPWHTTDLTMDRTAYVDGECWRTK